MMTVPGVVVVLSGKRKSGKDFVAQKLQERLGPDICAVLRLSEPLKKQYAEEHNLDITRLLDSTEYKEKFRKDMIVWGENKRNKDPEFFCNLATTGAESVKKIWIISDARRLTDVQYFMTYYGEVTLAVRIEASLLSREKRGFIFKSGVDDAASECGLDEYNEWDFTLYNNEENNEEICQGFSSLLQKIKSIIENAS